MTEKDKKLAAGSLKITQSIAMGVSGAAPAFSAAATTAALVAAVGVHSPSSILYCGLLMFGVTFAFMYLNRVYKNAGASYTWISHIFNRNLGFFAGWSLLVASTTFMVCSTIPLATSTLALFNPSLVNDPRSVSLVAAVWLTFVSAIVLKGIKTTSNMQVIFTFTEISILLIVIVTAFFHFINQPAHIINLQTFNPFNLSLDVFAKGALISVFFFWGWDVTLNLTEETKNPEESPSRAAFWSMVIIMLLFVAFIICALIALSDHEIEKSGTNILLYIADKIFPKPWGNIALISVILSSIGTIETSILQFTRTIFAKSRDGALNKRWTKIHSTWKTPWAETLLIWSLGMIFLLFASQEKSISSIISISIDAISFQVTCYYSLCGFACAWYCRSLPNKGFSKIISLIIWPVVSAIALISIAIYGAAYSFDKKSIFLGIGGVLIGAIPLMLNKRISSIKH